MSSPKYVTKRGNSGNTLRDECLNEHWFTSLPPARAVIEGWRKDYNGVRPHSSLGSDTPAEFARRCGTERREP